MDFGMFVLFSNTTSLRRKTAKHSKIGDVITQLKIFQDVEDEIDCEKSEVEFCVKRPMPGYVQDEMSDVCLLNGLKQLEKNKTCL